MEGQSVLGELLVIFALAVLVVLVLGRLRVPSIAGFIVAGMLLGPGALNLVPDPHQVESLAEVGVVLLLFGIGLELSFDRLKRLWRPVLIGGTLQMVGAIGATAALAVAFGMAWRPAVFLGFLVAVSSTAIVLRGLEERGELEAVHGRLVLGILVFQDLCVIPMMLAIPILAGQAGSPAEIASALGRAAAVLVGVVLVGRPLVKRVLALVAATRQRDLFVLTVCVVCLGIAWIGSLAGVSLALGAFLAGVVVADTEFRHQALAELIPFEEVLVSLFFISIGMLVDPRVLLAHPGPVLALLAVILAGKFVVMLAVGAWMRLPMRASVLAGAGLAQVGEFSFVMAHTAEGATLLPAPLAEWLSVAVTLSMLVTPLLLAAAPKLAAGLGRIPGLHRLLEVRTAEDLAAHHAAELEHHVIVAGYGLTGRELARELLEHAVPHVVVDMNPENVRDAAARGHAACFGDVTSPEVLRALGAARARELVLCINDSRAVTYAVKSARKVAPDLRIIVRTPYIRDVPLLLDAGATEVVPAEVQVALEIAGQVLRRRGLADDHVAGRLEGMRDRLAEELTGERRS
jgi:CPA2 family monovalent cation:H+ antiporter-2